MSNQLTTKLTLKSAAFSRVFPGFLRASQRAFCSPTRGQSHVTICPRENYVAGPLFDPLCLISRLMCLHLSYPPLTRPLTPRGGPLRSFAAAFVSAILRQSADPSASSVLPFSLPPFAFRLSPSSFARRLRQDSEDERPEIGLCRPPAQAPGRSSGIPPRQMGRKSGHFRSTEVAALDQDLPARRLPTASSRRPLSRVVSEPFAWQGAGRERQMNTRAIHCPRRSR
jgi:hypothetical protein